MEFDDELAKRIFGAAIYAALTDGERHEVKGGKIYRFDDSPWLISVSVLRDVKPDGGLRQEVQVTYDRRTVFRVIGTPSDPRGQQLLERGAWQGELLERWGP